MSEVFGVRSKIKDLYMLIYILFLFTCLVSDLRSGEIYGLDAYESKSIELSNWLELVLAQRGS